MLKVNYDEVALTYERRYAGGSPPELAKFVEAIGSPVGIGRVLEINCGTGQWLKKLQVVGLDLSTAMLRRAHERAPVAALIRGCTSTLSSVVFPCGTLACGRLGIVIRIAVR